jgi:hypothetical protein
MTTGVSTFDQSLNTTIEWLRDLQEEMGFDDEQRAFRVMRAVYSREEWATARSRMSKESCRSPSASCGLKTKDDSPAKFIVRSSLDARRKRR